MSGALLLLSIFHFPSVKEKTWVSSFRENAASCVPNYIVNLVSKGNIGSESPILLVTVNLLKPVLTRNECGKRTEFVLPKC